MQQFITQLLGDYLAIYHAKDRKPMCCLPIIKYGNICYFFMPFHLNNYGLTQIGV